MKITNAGPGETLGYNKNYSNKKISFSGELVFLKAAKNIIPSSDDIYVKTFEGEINWLSWISERLKRSYSKQIRLSKGGNDLFNAVKDAFESSENQKFLDTLYATSKENSKIYSAKLNKIVGQFQRAGVPYSECKALTSKLDFIEEINSYTPKDNLLSKKFNS